MGGRGMLARWRGSRARGRDSMEENEAMEAGGGGSSLLTGLMVG